jgi:hypothetical protein
MLIAFFKLKHRCVYTSTAMFILNTILKGETIQLMRKRNYELSSSSAMHLQYLVLNVSFKIKTQDSKTDC